MLAFVVWLSVAREPELATSVAVPVQFKNMPDNLDFGTRVPDHVNLELRGQAGRLSHNNLSDVGVVLDLAAARPGEHTYTIRSPLINLPYGVSFYRAIPSQITLSFDQLISRAVPIKPAFVNIPQGYQMQADSVQPASVRLRGPEQRVANITQVQTDTIDLSGVVGQKEFHTNVKVGDPQVRLETHAVISVDVTLAKVIPKGSR